MAPRQKSIRRPQNHSYECDSTSIAHHYRNVLRKLRGVQGANELIYHLTNMAMGYHLHALVLVHDTEKHVLRTRNFDQQLAGLYLLDSISKRLPQVYVPLFSTNLVRLFERAWRTAGVDVRMLNSLRQLRSTLAMSFPEETLILQKMDSEFGWNKTPQTENVWDGYGYYTGDQRNRSAESTIKFEAKRPRLEVAVTDYTSKGFEVRGRNVDTVSLMDFLHAKSQKLPSVLDEGNRACAICSEAFQEIFDGEKCEWKLQPAVCRNELNVHPACAKEHLDGKK